jgi:hypothetical protein
MVYPKTADNPLSSPASTVRAQVDTFRGLAIADPLLARSM